MTSKTCRGVYFKPYVYNVLQSTTRKLGISFNAIVNQILDHAIAEGKLHAAGKTLLLQTKRDQLLREEAGLLRRLRVILRSGAYLQDYAQRLLLGGEEEISRLKRRVGIYAHVNEKELDVILRILQRRENLVKELIDLEDQLLPQQRYPLALSDKGWKIGSRSLANDKHKSVKNVRTRKEDTLHGKAS